MEEEAYLPSECLRCDAAILRRLRATRCRRSCSRPR